MSNETMTRPSPINQPTYSLTARRFHWYTVAIVFIQIPLGFLTTYEGPAFKFSDVASGRLSSLHKLLGFILLWLVVARLIYRFRHGAPPDEPSLATWQKGASHATHWALYALLIAVSMSGWIGISLYGARELFGLVSLPALTAVDQPLSDKVFEWHLRGAVLILLLLGAHIGAALYHHFLRKDGVLRRMWPNVDRT